MTFPCRASAACAALAFGLASALTGSAFGQQAENKCVFQFNDAKGVTAASLIGSGFDIKAGWPGGLWLQKGKETYFCNPGIAREGAALCWTLREPVTGHPCQ
ncbi:MAG: hypothetical protein KIT25_08020 [Enhydrobacter sp.]|nr:MAG: hypothetical protein KIT25_08020 [Enhydrobacter sp.]